MIALYIVAGILLLITLVLSVPVDLVLNLRVGQDERSELRIGWFFGLVGKRLLPGKDRAKKARKPKKRRKATKWNVTSLLTVIRARGISGGIIRLVRRVLGSIRVRRLDADVRLGFENPADTGIIYAIIWPIYISRGVFRTARINIKPVFTGPTFEVTLGGNIRVFPAEVLVNVLRFVFSPAGFRFLRLMVALRWKKN